MAQFMYTDDIIASVKRRASIPTNNVTQQNSDFIAFANEEIALGLVPDVIKFHEDYLLRTEPISIIVNQLNYTIPYRAVGNKLKDLFYQDSNGNIYQMTRIDKSDIPHYNGVDSLAGGSKVFYVENNEIYLVGNAPSVASGSLLFVYYMRPNSLVMLNEVAVVTSINTTTGVVGVSSIPEDFSPTNQLYDFIQFKSPHKTLDFDITLSSLDSLTKELTFDPADLPSGLAIGDHIALATESAIPQVPSDLHVIIPHRVACRILEAQGDIEGLQMANIKLKELEDKLPTVIDNRVENSARKITNYNSFLRNGLRNKFRGR